MSCGAWPVGGVWGGRRRRRCAWARRAACPHLRARARPCTPLRRTRQPPSCPALSCTARLSPSPPHPPPRSEIIANLAKAAGLATMIAAMRPDIDNVDEYVRNTTARAFSGALGFSGLGARSGVDLQGYAGLPWMAPGPRLLAAPPWLTFLLL